MQVNDEFLRSIGWDECELFNVDEGVSTDVYKLVKNADIFFLRIMPAGENASSQVLAHSIMLAKGVLVPVVEYFEDFSAKIDGRSFMIVKNIGGSSLDKQIRSPGNSINPETMKNLLFEAGRQLALINEIPVDGFGEISRERVGQTDLCADEKNYQDWLESFLTKVEKLNKRKKLDRDSYAMILDYYYANRDFFDYDKAYLAHGDFDLTHIYSDGKNYTGIIDFGDIRGRSQYHDLAHFRYYSGNYLEMLIDGYQSVTDLGDDYEKRIKIEGLIIAIDEYWRWTGNLGLKYPEKAKGGQELFWQYLDSINQ